MISAKSGELSPLRAFVDYLVLLCGMKLRCSACGKRRLGFGWVGSSQDDRICCECQVSKTPKRFVPYLDKSSD